jgi:hypothetical protein
MISPLQRKTATIRRTATGRTGFVGKVSQMLDIDCLASVNVN